MEKGIMKTFRAEQWLWNHHMKPLAMVIKGTIRIVWGTVLWPTTQIGEGTMITYHGLGTLIHKHSIIGKNCVIRQHVTIGSDDTGFPILGDNVEIGAGAIIVGGIHIGNNVKIGANAFVNTDLPDNCTAVGLPAKPVKFHEPTDN